MKRYILSAISIVGALSMTSCTDFLDTKSEGEYSPKAYFNTDQQSIDAMDGVYSRLAQENMFGREIFWEQAAGTDIVWGRTRSYPTLATMKYTGDESPLRGFWEQSYKHGARANWIVESLLKKQKQRTLSEIETRTLGEAYFMRALYHFYIAYRYGTDKLGVPFTKYEDYPDGYDYSIPEQKKTVIDNYRLIIEDLQNAEKLLPSSYDAANFGRAQKVSAVGYMARVYAYWACWDKSQWANVVASVDKLENTYGRALCNDYEQNFTDDMTQWDNTEYLFSMPSNGGTNGGGCEFPGVVLENKGWGIFNGWGQIKPSYDIYEQFTQDDSNLIDPAKGNIRKIRSVLEYNQEFQFFGETRKFFSVSDVEAGFMINKYMKPFGRNNATQDLDKGMGYVNPNGDWPTARLNVPLIRFADCLLLRAEAKIMQGQDGTADINKVRNRANVKSLDHTATMADMYHERRVELAFEFTDHAFDLKRWHKSGDAVIKALAEKELNANPRVRYHFLRMKVDGVEYDGYLSKKTSDESDIKCIYLNLSDNNFYEKQESNGSVKMTPTNLRPEKIANEYRWGDRENPKAPFYIAPYGDPSTVKTGSYEEKMMTFPFPSEQVSKSNGALKQNPAY